MSGIRILRRFAPPVLVEFYGRFRGDGLRFSRCEGGWTEALSLSRGYSADLILNRVIEATRKVTSGEAAFERDGVTFEMREYPFAILAGILRASVLNGGNLEVVDFGGSLGSTFRQCRPFLSDTGTVRWYVVEQASFVAAGLREFSTSELSFFASMSEIPPISSNAIILASSVLQYMEDPVAVLCEMARYPARHLLIDRTPMGLQSDHFLSVQRVPRRIYEASYPCWIFSRDLLLSYLSKHWSVVADFTCAEGAMRTECGIPFEFRGLLLEKAQ